MTAATREQREQLEHLERVKAWGGQPSGEPLTDNGPPAPELLPVVRILEGDAPTPPGMLVDDLVLDGDINLLAGGGGAFKSVVVLLIAICVALGRPVWDSLTVHRSGRVLLVCPEDGEAIVRMVLDAIIAGLNLDASDRATLRDRLVMVCDTKLVNLTTDTGLLRRTALEYEAVLVVLDPLRNLLVGADESDNSVASVCVDALRRDVCRLAGAAVLINAHIRKPSRDNGPDTTATVFDLRGASAWANGARLVFGASAQGNRVTLRGLKANRLKADLRHELLVEIEVDPDDKARWRSCTVADANAGARSEGYTPGIGRALNSNERSALGALDDTFEPGRLFSHSGWLTASGIASEGTFRHTKDRLIRAGLACAVPTGKRSPVGGAGYSYSLTDEGRSILASYPAGASI